MKRLLLLSGPIASGKSSVSIILRENFGFWSVSSSSFLKKTLVEKGEVPDRRRLQDLGDRLDICTDFSWVVDSVARPAFIANSNVDNWLVDAVRKSRQVELFRSCFAGAVRHVHLNASDNVLRQRAADRGGHLPVENGLDSLHPNELSAISLGNIADKNFDTETTSSLEIALQLMDLWEE